jgi:hypothetical protein
MSNDRDEFTKDSQAEVESVLLAQPSWREAIFSSKSLALAVSTTCSSLS